MSQRGPLHRRLWAKVRFPDTSLPFDHQVNRYECWEWTGALSKKRRSQRRPVIRLGGRETPAKLVSRIVCEWFNGPPPTPTHEAGHTCPKGENCKCVNPWHLRWMTRVENEQYKHRGDQDGTDGKNGYPFSEEPEGGAGRGEGRGCFTGHNDQAGCQHS